MYALVDCNNFYCSCERIFQPKLEGRAVVVLSNNDGCVIARSEEAKQMGIVMGTPAHIVSRQQQSGTLKVFSSNYTLYGDMSNRVMETLGQFAPSVEIYSIDEAFLDFHDVPGDLAALSIRMRKTIQQNLGLPVSIGVAQTKTLAKMANRFAKKKHRDTGVFWAANDALRDEMLRFTPVDGVWGIGHQHALLLQKNGFSTAAEFAAAPDDWVREHMSVVGLRTLFELRGIPTIGWQQGDGHKKNICSSRSFGHTLLKKDEIAEAVSNYAAICARKLREQRCCAATVIVMLQTNPHKGFEQQYMRTVTIQLEQASNVSGDIIRAALKGLEIIFKPGLRYMKAGVVVDDFVPETAVQAGLFETKNGGRKRSLLQVMDSINDVICRDQVRMASQGFERTYQMRADHRSPRYTTNINEILKVRI
jgi:DNA polymerase V